VLHALEQPPSDRHFLIELGKQILADAHRWALSAERLPKT
jgi:hypothetical protein